MTELSVDMEADADQLRRLVHPQVNRKSPRIVDSRLALAEKQE